MDTSETYIKMSEKARFFIVKPKHAWQDGDFYVSQNTNGFIGSYVKVYCEEDIGGIPQEDQEDFYKSLIPIYRQDQLQEMIRRTDIYARPLVAIFAKWVHEELDHILLRHLISMEQLWLAFVMKEKYNKLWNGEEWDKI